MKGFVIPAESFVKIGITKIFCYYNKMFSYINKTFGCCSKIFGCSNKIFFIGLIPNFVTVTKPFFPCRYTAYICKNKARIRSCISGVRSNSLRSLPGNARSLLLVRENNNNL